MKMSKSSGAELQEKIKKLVANAKKNNLVKPHLEAFKTSSTTKNKALKLTK